MRAIKSVVVVVFYFFVCALPIKSNAVIYTENINMPDDKVYSDYNAPVIEIMGDEKVNISLGKKSEFNNNVADFGSCILNQNPNATVFVGRDAVFKNNQESHSVSAGAIYNRGKIIFESAIFANNFSDGQKNDIFNYENGEIVIRRGITLDGGIINLGYRDIVFDKGAILRVNAGETVILSDVDNRGAVLDFVFSPDYVGGRYKLIDGYLNEEFIIAKNPFYEIEETDTPGTYIITKKNYSEIANFLGVDNNSLTTAQGLISMGGAESQTPTKDALIMKLIESEEDGEEDFIDSLPEDLVLQPIKRVYAMQNANSLHNMAELRFESTVPFDIKKSGRNFWVSTEYSVINEKQPHSNSDPYQGAGKIVAFGFDGKMTDNFKLGTGLAFSSFDFDTDDLMADGYSGFIYAEHNTSKRFINGFLSYSYSKYRDFESGVPVDSMSHSYSLAGFVGKDVKFWGNNVIAPQIGLNYFKFFQNQHYDGAGNLILDNTSDVFGLSGGAKYAYKKYKSGYNWTISAKIMATYDVVKQGDNLRVQNGLGAISEFYIQEAGDMTADVGLNFGLEIGKMDLSVGYNGAINEKFSQHSAVLGVKLRF